ncbi:hypothetical protein [Bacillus sp. FJAT-50079]|uniref:hypothetical protein n=1 Tax=Bacillus sp. FJAT-50079 TaxID=2833577 RepID=UPI001BC9FBCE|nr:hypothetical protein [Bacillus sp. FJAT-50079]MBS4207499.1 hypothetical protein [Bacillus sp. FJAT-50079]
MTKELDNMPIWQNHEQRITTLEVTMSGLTNKMDSVERTIKEGNSEQKGNAYHYKQSHGR